MAGQRQIAPELFALICVGNEVPGERDENRVACRANGRGTRTKAGDKKSVGSCSFLIGVTSTQRSIGDVYYTFGFRANGAGIHQISTMPPSTITVWPVM